MVEKAEQNPFETLAFLSNISSSYFLPLYIEANLHKSKLKSRQHGGYGEGNPNSEFWGKRGMISCVMVSKKPAILIFFTFL